MSSFALTSVSECFPLTHSLTHSLLLIDGVYDSDPKKNPDAKKLDETTYEKLRELTSGSNALPGEYRLMDGMCLLILERSAIPAQIIKGDSESIESAFDGKTVGTVIRKQ